MQKRANPIKEAFYLLVILALALIVRLDFLTASGFRIDSDEAIVGLMGKHILEGAEIPCFYYGQHYLGSFEAIVASWFFSVFGVSVAALKAVPLVFSLLLVIVIYLIAFEIGGIRAGRFAALYLALPPSILVIWSSKARGGFIELVLIGALSFLLTLKWLKTKNKPGFIFVLISLLLGFGWWVNNQIIYFMLPVGLAWLSVALHERKLSFFRRFIMFPLLGLLGFIAGGLPYWIYNIKNDFVSLEMFNSASGSDFLEHLDGFFSTALPIILGAKRYWQTREVFPFSSVIIYTLIILFLLIIMIRKEGSVIEFCLLRIKSSSIGLILIFILGCFSVFTLSSFGYLVQAPRYLLPAYAGIAVVFGYGVSLVWGREKKAAQILILMVLAVNLASCYLGRRAIPGEPFVFKQQRVSEDNQELIDWLEEEKINWVRTNYWIGYRLAFETKEEVRFLVFGKPGQVRVKAYEEEGRKENVNTMPFVLVPAQAEYLETALSQRGYSYERKEVSGYVVIYKLKPIKENLKKLDSSVLYVETDYLSEEAESALDGDIKTRWRTAAPQSPEMTFTVLFHKPKLIRGIKYKLGEWWHDYPRGFSIEIEDAAERTVQIFDPQHYEAIRYSLGDDNQLDFYFQPVRARKIFFKQTGKDKVFDWSIAELEIYE